MSLLHLPDELLESIASHLPFEDIVHLQQVCRRWHDVVETNATLQYAIELRVAGMIDNPASRLVPGERLRLLRAKEHAWREIDLSDKRSLTLGHRPSGIYDLTGGTLLLGERRNSDSYTGTDAIHTVDLHSVFSESTTRPRWSNIDLAKQVIDVGLAIQEHDLIAVVTYSYVHEAQLLASIDIHLLKHSTGQPHPAAAKPVLHFGNIHYLPSHCSMMLEVTGDSLCFLLNNYFPFINADPVTFVVYNWKTGVPFVGQKRIYSDPTMFNSFVLLSSDLVALPIIPSNALEICQFTDELNNQPPAAPPSEKEPEDVNVAELKTACILELPSLHSGALVLRMTCRCEPNPRGPPPAATYADTGIPFYCDPEQAVMVLHMHLRLPTGIARVYTMIVHRSSLLRIVNAIREGGATTSASEGASTSATANAGGEHARSQSPETTDAVPHDDALLEEDEGPVRVPWVDWGPAVTRWFKDELSGTRWITTTCGQRFVRAHPNGRLRVIDFNRLAIKRYAHARSLSGSPIGALPGEEILEKGYRDITEREDDEEHWEDSDGEDVDEWEAELRRTVQAPGPAGDSAYARRVNLVLGTTAVEDGSAWEGLLDSGLPYMEISVPVPDDYESVLLDEDMILGLKMENDGRHIREVVVHRIGGSLAI